MANEGHETFGELRARLDEIVVEVRDKDLSLEKSLDLYEEAIKIGNRCAELVDKPDYTDEEAAQAAQTLESEEAEGGEAPSGGGAASEEAASEAASPEAAGREDEDAVEFPDASASELDSGERQEQSR